jgi:hypothetical protein
MLLASLYVVIRGNAASAPHLRSSARSILHITPQMPLILIVSACFLAGSLYTTALEGFVDWVHRALVVVDAGSQQRWLVRRITGALAPLSIAARSRLGVEAARFFQEFGAPAAAAGSSAVAVHDFVDNVFADVLWMDGKLCGLPLRDLYAEYRSEGELRLGTALLLPLGAYATGYAMRLDWGWLTLIGLVSLAVATKLASYGMYYYRRAHSLLAHHIADGGLLAPCMETLKSNRSYTPSAPNTAVFE